MDLYFGFEGTVIILLIIIMSLQVQIWRLNDKMARILVGIERNTDQLGL